MAAQSAVVLSVKTAYPILENPALQDIDFIRPARLRGRRPKASDERTRGKAASAWRAMGIWRWSGCCREWIRSGMKHVCRPQKPMQTAAFRDETKRRGTAAIEFQERCLKPLGHPSLPKGCRSFSRHALVKVPPTFGIPDQPPTPFDSTGLLIRSQGVSCAAEAKRDFVGSAAASRQRHSGFRSVDSGETAAPSPVLSPTGGNLRRVAEAQPDPTGDTEWPASENDPRQAGRPPHSPGSSLSRRWTSPAQASNIRSKFT